jgi:hypothetical protein
MAGNYVNMCMVIVQQPDACRRHVFESPSHGYLCKTGEKCCHAVTDACAATGGICEGAGLVCAPPSICAD